MTTTRKQEFTTEELLVAALYALNKAPRFRVETECGRDSYDVAAAIDRLMESARYLTPEDWHDIELVLNRHDEPDVAGKYEGLRKKVRAIVALRTA